MIDAAFNGTGYGGAIIMTIDSIDQIRLLFFDCGSLSTVILDFRQQIFDFRQLILGLFTVFLHN